MFKKFTFRIILFLVIIATVTLVYNFADYIIKKNETTTIFEISNTEDKYQSQDKNAIIEKHYMIINPPKELLQLKVLVEKHHNENSIDNLLDTYSNENKYYSVFYYRESRSLPRTWQPNGGFLTSDNIDQHKFDCIAAIFWSNKDDKKELTVMVKDSSHSNYGKVIQKKEFLIDIPLINENP